MASKANVKPEKEEKNGTLALIPTTDKENELSELEEIIHTNLLAFQKVGMALKQIRDKNLYRPHHRNFDAYCRDRWNMGRNFAHKLIAASRVMENLGTIVHTVPLNEAQARPLSTIKEPEDQKKVWNQIVDSKPKDGITSRFISKAVREFKGEHPNKKPELFHSLCQMLDTHFDVIEKTVSESFYENDEFFEKWTITASVTYKREVDDEDDADERVPMMIELN